MIRSHGQNKRVVLSTALFVFSAVFSAVLLSAAHPALAELGVNLLAPIQGIDQSSFSGYLSSLFSITLGVAAFLAVIMIAIGGLQYMGSEVVSDKSDAKDRITSAILGLLLILFSVALLNTINPNILNMQFNPPKLEKIPDPPKPTRKVGDFRDDLAGEQKFKRECPGGAQNVKRECIPSEDGKKKCDKVRLECTK